MRREDKIRALKAEYSNLERGLVADRGEIRQEWAHLGVQRMRELEERIFKAEARMVAIRKSKSWSEIV